MNVFLNVRKCAKSLLNRFSIINSFIINKIIQIFFIYLQKDKSLMHHCVLHKGKILISFHDDYSIIYIFRNIFVKHFAQNFHLYLNALKMSIINCLSCLEKL